jgi:hypothetical protein
MPISLIIREWLKMRSTGGKHILKYIDNACPRISTENNNDVNHFGLISFYELQLV